MESGTANPNVGASEKDALGSLALSVDCVVKE
jgi:hypothetical protein